MYEVTEQPFESYEQYKNTMDQTVGATVQNIVKIGYLLKIARDTGILEESGYTTMRDFAMGEYNIDPSTASRFIGINDRYSLGGNSMELDDKYNGFETSKLAEMLTLPDEIIEEIPPEMKRDEIREIKAQVKEESQTSDMEMYIESASTAESDVSDLHEVLKQAFETNYEMFAEIDRVYGESEGIEDVFNALAPAGYAALIGRIPGKGRLMLSIKSLEADPVLINTRTGEQEICPWNDIDITIEKILKRAKPEDPQVHPLEDYRETFGHDPEIEEKKSAVTVSNQAKPKTEKPKETRKATVATAEMREKAQQALDKMGADRQKDDEHNEDPESKEIEKPEEAAVEKEASEEKAAGVADISKMSTINSEIAPAQSDNEAFLDMKCRQAIEEFKTDVYIGDWIGLRRHCRELAATITMLIDEE